MRKLEEKLRAPLGAQPSCNRRRECRRSVTFTGAGRRVARGGRPGHRDVPKRNQRVEFSNEAINWRWLLVNCDTVLLVLSGWDRGGGGVVFEEGAMDLEEEKSPRQRQDWDAP